MNKTLLLFGIFILLQQFLPGFDILIFNSDHFENKEFNFLKQRFADDFSFAVDESHPFFYKVAQHFPRNFGGSKYLIEGLHLILQYTLIRVLLILTVIALGSIIWSVTHQTELPGIYNVTVHLILVLILEQLLPLLEVFFSHLPHSPLEAIENSQPHLIVFEEDADELFHDGELVF